MLEINHRKAYVENRISYCYERLGQLDDAIALLYGDLDEDDITLDQFDFERSILQDEIDELNEELNELEKERGY